MEKVVPRQQVAVTPTVQLGDIVALVASAVIVVSYAVLPLRMDSATTGLGFIDSTTTFPVLTLVVGIVGVVSALVSIAILHERAVRWWFFGLGVLGMVFLLDNTLREKANLSSGGWLAILGSATLLLQAAIPRVNGVVGIRTHEIVLGLIRISLATLWFTQLLWKLPWNNYGCAAGALVPAAGSSGLCDWIGREIASPRWPAYKSFLEGFVTPNLNWLALLIVAGEAFVALTLMLGLFTRVGAFAGTLMAINLFVGLTAVPAEWDWTYLMLIALNVVFIIVGGRFVGLDALLHSRFKRLAERGSLPGRLLVFLVS